MQKIIVVKAILFNSDGQILLIRRSKTAPRRALEWDFPGGFVDDEDESYKHATLREVAEETGLEVASPGLHLAFTESKIGLEPGEKKDVSWLYMNGKVESTEVKLSYEHDDYKWVSIEEALKLIKYDTQLRALEYILSVFRADTSEG